MTLPPRLEHALRSDSSLYAAIHDSVGRFEALLDVSRLPFFPDFTDHGPKHLQGVLAVADSLMTSEAAQLLTPQDAAAFVVASVVHDLGMHLTPDGLRALISDPCPPLLIDDRPWPALWDDFNVEARRFGDVDNIRIFGTRDPVPPPELESNNWTENQFRLLGEFIRRHHARLAHEVAVYGFPGAGTSSALAIDVKPGELAHLAGLVARSHGTPLRTSVDQIQRKYRNRVAPLNVHVSYLMVLLRLADYLQLDSDRAPSLRLRIQSLRSPVSQLEWQKYQAIVGIEDHPEDPEAKFVRVGPPRDVKTYLALRQLLADIQRELDDCWAVLGEVYGLQVSRGLNALGITIRRLRSNIEDSDFAGALPFVPERARFRAAEGHLLPRLVAPLYGNRPEFGVRELVQNSMDAVREFDAWCSARQQDSSSLCRNDFDVDVLVSLKSHNDKEFTLTIKDRGIGMTADTITRYFLVAGASYRDNEIWRRQFLDNRTKPTVLRAGRFGVGVLAAFLLGDQITVSTRHASQAEGVEFTAGLNTDPIELRRCSRPVGTTIQIHLNSETAERLIRDRLSWDWCVWKSPSVSRTVDGVIWEQKEQVPSTPAEAWPEWLVFSCDTQTVYWRPELSHLVTCNGIRVVPGYSGLRYWCDSEHPDRNSGYGHVLWPDLAVVDPDGKFPLNLSRTEFEGHLWRAEQTLRSEIAKDVAAALLELTPEAPPWQTKSYLGYSGRLLSPPPGLGRFIYWPDGVSLYDLRILRERSDYCVVTTSDDLTDLPRFFSGDLRFPVSPPGSTQSRPTLQQLIHGSGISGVRAHIARDSRKADGKTVRVLSTTKHGKCGRSRLRRQIQCCSPGCDVFELYYERTQQPQQYSFFAEEVVSFLGAPVVPYSVEERRNKFGPALNALRHYIERWKAMRQRWMGERGS